MAGARRPIVDVDSESLDGGRAKQWIDTGIVDVSRPMAGAPSRIVDPDRLIVSADRQIVGADRQIVDRGRQFVEWGRRFPRRWFVGAAIDRRFADASWRDGEECGVTEY